MSNTESLYDYWRQAARGFEMSNDENYDKNEFVTITEDGDTETHKSYADAMKFAKEGMSNCDEIFVYQKVARVRENKKVVVTEYGKRKK